MLNPSDIEIIENYLSKKLSDDEIALFNERLMSDKTFAEEFYVMKDIYEGIRAAGRIELKQQLSTIRNIPSSEKNVNFKPFKIIGIAASILVVLGLAYFLNDQYSFFGSDKNALTINRLTQPIFDLSSNYERHVVHSNKSSFIHLRTGEYLNIQRDIFVNDNGILLKDNVTISSFTYNSVFDQFIGGIPTVLDSSGKVFHLQDANIFKLSFSNPSNVSLAKEGSIDVLLPVYSIGKEYNLYKLDTIDKKWSPYHYKTVDISRIKNQKLAFNLIVPKLEDRSKPRFRIIANPSEFPELAAYKNYVFEVVNSQQSFNFTDTQKVWKNAVIQKSKSGNLYQVTFLNDSRSSTYQVIPVFPNQYYAAAKLIYHKKMSEIISNQGASFNDKEIELVQKLLASSDNNYHYCLMSIEGSGVYAYGKLKHTDNKQERAISFVDSNNHVLVIKQLAIADLAQHVLYRYKPNRSNKQTLDISMGNCIFAVTGEDSFAYLTPDEFSRITLSPEGTSLKLNIVKIDNDNYHKIKGLFSYKTEMLGKL